MQEGHCKKRSRFSKENTKYKHESNSLLETHFKTLRSAGQSMPFELAKKEETTDFHFGFCSK
jgi:hypothetical protein